MKTSQLSSPCCTSKLTLRDQKREKPHKAIRPCRAVSSVYWGGWTRTTNFLVNSQALCQLSYAPSNAADLSLDTSPKDRSYRWETSGRILRRGPHWGETGPSRQFRGQIK